jgi:hypothetical protein
MSGSLSLETEIRKQPLLCTHLIFTLHVGAATISWFDMLVVFFQVRVCRFKSEVQSQRGFPAHGTVSNQEHHAPAAAGRVPLPRQRRRAS